MLCPERQVARYTLQLALLHIDCAALLTSFIQRRFDFINFFLALFVGVWRYRAPSRFFAQLDKLRDSLVEFGL